MLFFLPQHQQVSAKDVAKEKSQSMVPFLSCPLALASLSHSHSLAGWLAGWLTGSLAETGVPHVACFLET